MKNVLCIAYSCPPILDPQSILLAKMLRPLRELGYRVQVVGLDPDTCVVSVDPDLTRLLPADPPPVRVAASERRLWQRAVARYAPSLLRMPDRYAPVHFRAVRAGRALHAARRADLLFSWAQYHSCSLVALRLKRVLGIPWVAHFSDPWSDHPYRRLPYYLRRINAGMEEAVIRSADAVVFVSEETRDWTLSRYPTSWKSKTHVIPHCFESALYPERAAPRSGIVFRHIGHFYGARGAGHLLEAIARARASDPLRLRDVRIELIGRVESHDQEQVRRMGLEDLVQLRPWLAYLESLREMRDADVLILVEAPTENNLFLPSKLVDYLGAGAPVLALSPSRGPASKWLTGPGDRVIAPEDVDGVEAALRGYVERLRSGERDRLRRAPESVSRLEARVTMGKLAEVFASVSGGG